MIIYIGDNHPTDWLTGKEEARVIEQVFSLINDRYKNESNLFINSTWFGQHIPEGVNTNWQDAQELINKGHTFDNLFYLSMVDPDWCDKDAFSDLVLGLGNPEVHFLGSFDHHPGQFHAFGYITPRNFKQYDPADLFPVDFTYKFINYNRKPKEFRVQLVDAILEHNLDKHGIVTLGASDTRPAVTVEEIDTTEDSSGDDDGHNIPNDIMSLGDMRYWNHHFLNIVSETDMYGDVFLSEKTFKPIIGMRPFIINGNVRTYEVLEKEGFKMYDHLFPYDLRTQGTLHHNIIKTLEWLAEQADETLRNMYNDMYKDLLYNRDFLYNTFSVNQETNMMNCLPWSADR